MGDDESAHEKLPDLPVGMADALASQQKFGGFLLFQGLEPGGYAILLGGIYNVMLSEAHLAADRALTAFNARNLMFEAGATAAALLCAAAACEARLSEHLAHYETVGGSLPDELEKTRRNANAREQWRGLIRFAAPTFDLGARREYLALGCLFALRDTIAHRSARLAIPGAVPDRIVDCVRQLPIPLRDQPNRDWTSAVLVHEVANWGVQVAQGWINLVNEVVPIHC
jgi:hypothetical protein